MSTDRVQAPEIVGVKVYNGEDVVTDGTILECDVRWDSACRSQLVLLAR